jgi:FkbM family methyltransferase
VRNEECKALILSVEPASDNMRKLLNRLLSPVGYRIERLSRFQREMAPLSHRPGGFKFAQIGANDGVRFDCLYELATRYPCSGIVVEPLPDMFERLRSNYADYPTIVPVNKAIHESARSLELFRVSPSAIATYPGWASGLASFDREHLVRHQIASADICAQRVECVTLMELLECHSLLDLDLLQIDTEGYDGAIVRMIDFSRCRPRVIKFEHKNLSDAEREVLDVLLARNKYTTATEGTDTVAWLGS